MRAPVKGLTASLLPPLAQAITVNVAVIACYLAQAGLTALLLHRLMMGGSSARIAIPLMLLVGVIALRAGLLWLSEIAAQRVAATCKTVLRRRLLQQLTRFGPGIGLVHKVGDLQSAVIGGVEAVESYYSRYLPAVGAALLGSGLVLGVMLWIDWPSGLLLAGFVLAFPLLDRVWMRWQRPQAIGVFAAMRGFTNRLMDALRGLETLKAFGASPRWRAKLAQDAAELRRTSMATLNIMLMRGGITRLITLSGIALVLAFNAWRVAEQQLSPMVLLLTLFLAREAFRPLGKLENAFHTAWAASGAQRSIAKLLALSPPVVELSQPKALPNSYSLHVDTLSFTYPQGQPALTDVSFSIEEQQFVAIVGPSGAGKSTLMALLLRSFDPQQGTIRLGGVDIRQLTLQTLRQNISLVSQEVFLFHGSIADNLRIAKPDASDEELAAAARAAQIADFIEQLPQGYQTQVGERGAQLSGGQRQRLAITRALLKDAPILLLDEATASIDCDSELALQQALAQFRGRRTVIAIAHRLESIKHADLILVFEEGRLVEQGQHQQLSVNGGCYARLLAAQEERV
ncbi:ABC transporter ATP-binding protein [Ewingella americana]|uniref:ABC transporter ATP-binding protein n=1 Tax=Ewingella americana TaxID=41202 RepID=UPI00163990AC|nr:ATP-binding cassette domain-containing protein [Ewingella americana]QMV52673.1 ATP-binding cassette domain-containing protein [Ewingella americana]